MKGFKAFNKGLICRNFQFEEGKTYEEEGKPSLCQKGFHFCENPLDTLDFYDLTESEFAEVEALGEIDKSKDSNTKHATSKIKIKARISLPGFIKASFEYLWNECNIKEKDIKDDSSKLAASGDSSKLAASGDSSKLAASGYYSKLAASGDSSSVEINGKYSIGVNIGFNGIIKGKLGSWITLAEYDKKGKPLVVISAKIDGKELLPDIWYKLIDGKFQEI